MTGNTFQLCGSLPHCQVPSARFRADPAGRRTPTYLELTELRRPTGENSTGELTADPRDRPLLLALGVDAGPIPTSGPRRVPGPGVRGEETAGNMSAESVEEAALTGEKREPRAPGA